MEELINDQIKDYSQLLDDVAVEVRELFPSLPRGGTVEGYMVSPTKTETMVYVSPDRSEMHFIALEYMGKAYFRRLKSEEISKIQSAQPV